MFPAMGMPEMIIIMVVVLLLFGANRLPEIARGIGKSINEFRKAAEDVKKEININDD